MWLTKYNASGNDFLIFHTFKKANYSNLAKKLCNRHSGIGADGLAVLLPHDQFAYCWDFYNSDGSKANMCGNASRCVGHYAYCNKLASRNHSFLSSAGEIKVQVRNNAIEVNLGVVTILRDNIQEYGLYFTLLDSGVPHLVAFVKDKSQIPLTSNAMLVNLREKYNANINIATIIDKNKIALMTYERGVEDITLACGTGMASAFYLAFTQQQINNNAILIPPSGDTLQCRIENNEIYFKGKVVKIGNINI